MPATPASTATPPTASSAAVRGYGPGGDFYWLTKTYTWSGHGGTEESSGDNHGHNVVSPAYGLTEDMTLTNAPGGDFDAQLPALHELP